MKFLLWIVNVAIDTLNAVMEGIASYSKANLHNGWGEPLEDWDEEQQRRRASLDKQKETK